MIQHPHASLALKLLPSPLYPLAPGVHEGFVLKPGCDLDFSVSVGIRISLPFSGSSSFNVSIEHECIDQDLTAIPYDTMQHEAGCQPEAATANAANTSTSSNEAAAPARQALIEEVHSTLPTYTPDQDRMTTKYLASGPGRHIGFF